MASTRKRHTKNALRRGLLTLSYSSFVITFFFIYLSYLANIAWADSRLKETDLVGFHQNASDSPLLPLINGAKKSIDIEIYMMEDNKVRAALRKALNRNVNIRIIQEPVPLGGRCRIFTPVTAKDDERCLDQKSLVRELNKKGPKYVAFNKAELCGVLGKACFQHGKMVLVDGKYAMVSTGNFNSTSLCHISENPAKCDRDYSVVSDDPEVVATFQKIFNLDFIGFTYDLDAVLTKKIAQKVTVSPVSLPEIIRFIKSASQTLQIQNQYLNEPTINEALKEVARRGVAVEITVASVCSFGPPTEYKKTQIKRVYGEFDRLGISSRFFTKNIMIGGKNGYLHAKAIIIDNDKAWVGSMNGSMEAATMNREFGLFFENAQWVRQLETVMKSDHVDPQAESWQDSLACANDRA